MAALLARQISVVVKSCKFNAMNTSPLFIAGMSKAFLQQREKSSLTLAVALKTLHLKEDCTKADVREAFIKQAKIFHPDSTSEHANEEKFSLLSESYELVLGSLKTKGNSVQEFEEKDYSLEEILRQTLPLAHRKYLTNDGIGFGTPSQRQKQYEAYRMNRANTLVSDYKMKKIQRETEDSELVIVKEFAKRTKATHFVDRMVEDMILESMAMGEFKDLKGGKIETPDLPYVNQSEFHLNKVLINNGFAPGWIQTKQQISLDIQKARHTLLNERKKLHLAQRSKVALDRWKEKRKEFVDKVASINKEIGTYNLITPVIQSQMVLLDPEVELKKMEIEFREFLKSEEYKSALKEFGKNAKNERQSNIFTNAFKNLFS